MRAVSRSYANAGRGGHRLAFEASTHIHDCREALAEFFTILDPTRIAFTANTTQALNYAIKGVVRKGDHIIVSEMEHNSVARVAFSYGDEVEVSIAKADEHGYVSVKSVEREIRPNTKLIAVLHASNVCGTINPIEEIGAVTSDSGILFLVDCAQSAGILPINVLDARIDMLAFAGHKALYGPQGTGGLYVRNDVDLNPIIHGGTGSMSESMQQPSFMPDVLESGTLNAAGIAGLHEGIKFISRIGLDEICRHEQVLMRKLIEAFANMDDVIIYGTKKASEQTGVLGFNIKNQDCVEMANLLSTRYNIATRAGFHCAPLAHGALGTRNCGMIRASVSWFTEMREIQKLVDAVWRIIYDS
jgi:cysteine desulfurase family protein